MLLDCHVLGVLVGVSVKSNFVSCVANSGHFLGESLQRVSWDEPGRFDVVLVKELEYSLGSHGGCPDACWWTDMMLEHCIPSLNKGETEVHTATNITGRVFTTVRAQPSRNGINVNAVCDKNALLSHY